jgi:hypothetical protein
MRVAAFTITVLVVPLGYDKMMRKGRFLLGMRIRLFAHLADEDPDEPETTGEAGHQDVEQEVAELVLLLASTAGHVIAFLFEKKKPNPMWN